MSSREPMDEDSRELWSVSMAISVSCLEGLHRQSFWACGCGHWAKKVLTDQALGHFG